MIKNDNWQKKQLAAPKLSEECANWLIVGCYSGSVKGNPMTIVSLEQSMISFEWKLG